MTACEFSRPVKARSLPEAPLAVEADDGERAALAARFGVRDIQALSASIGLSADGADVLAEGTLSARVIQTCAVSGEAFAVTIKEPLSLRFVPAVARAHEPEDEFELSIDELDHVEFENGAFDIGEAVAQSLGLAIDPYAEGPQADAARKAAGITDENAPRGALADALSQFRTPKPAP